MAPNQDTVTQRGAIYASALDDGMASIRNQLDVALSYAERNNLLVVEGYVDLRGEHGRLLRMMADAAAAEPPFGKVLVSELSRISRRADELNEHSGEAGGQWSGSSYGY